VAVVQWLTLSQEGWPHTIYREREREREMGLSQYCDGYHVLRFFGVRCLKRRHAQQLNEANRQAFIDPDL